MWHGLIREGMQLVFWLCHTKLLLLLSLSLQFGYNLIRLENEHLNNVGKYRAFKSVPLPFNYYDDDKDD